MIEIDRTFKAGIHPTILNTLYERNNDLHLILNELMLRFNQLSSIMLLRALNLFTSKFAPILYLAQLLTRNLVDLPLKFCWILRSIQSGDLFSEL